MNIQDFEITECDRDNLINLCSIKKSDETSFFLANRVYTKKDSKLCEKQDDWVIYENIGEFSCCAKIFRTNCRKNDNKLYVMKMIKRRADQTEESFKKFVFNEIEIENDVYRKTGLTTPVYQVFVDKDTIMFVTDMLKVTVKRFIIDELLKEVPDIDKIKKIYKRCFEILDELYKKDIIHNDPQLDNFMLTQDDQVNVIDFGYSKIGKEHTVDLQETKDLDYRIIAISLYKIYIYTPVSRRYVVDELAAYDKRIENEYNRLVKQFYEAFTTQEKTILSYIESVPDKIKVKELIKRLNDQSKLGKNFDEMVKGLRVKSSIYHTKEPNISKYIVDMLKKLY